MLPFHEELTYRGLTLRRCPGPFDPPCYDLINTAGKVVWKCEKEIDIVKWLKNSDHPNDERRRSNLAHGAITSEIRRRGLTLRMCNEPTLGRANHFDILKDDVVLTRKNTIEQVATWLRTHPAPGRI